MKINNPRVILISGTPGTGKTTISEIISKKMNLNLINLSKIVIEKKFIFNRDEQRDTEIVDEKKLIKFLTTEILRFPEGLLIEGHYADITPSEFVDCCIILRSNPVIIQERLIKRKYKKSKIMENIQAEILGVCVNDCINAYGPEKVFEIDTSKGNIEEISLKIIDIIKKKTTIFLAGKINWLSSISENDLRNYFGD